MSGLFRKRQQRKHLLEASAAPEARRPMSWDRSWDTNVASNTDSWQRRLDSRRLNRLDDDIAETGHDIDHLRKRLESERGRVAELNDLQARKRALLDELRAVEQERAAVATETKEMERQLRVQQLRTERQADRVEWPRYGRPVRIEVDDGAWGAIRLVTIHQRTTLRVYVGDLVAAEAELFRATPDLGPPSSRRRRSPGEAAPVPRRRFLRIDVDDDLWATIRLAATTLDLTTTRYLGEVVESAAYQLGQRCT
jgi:hypothetical protein